MAFFSLIPSEPSYRYLPTGCKGIYVLPCKSSMLPSALFCGSQFLDEMVCFCVKGGLECPSPANWPGSRISNHVYVRFTSKEKDSKVQHYTNLGPKQVQISQINTTRQVGSKTHNSNAVAIPSVPRFAIFSISKLLSSSFNIIMDVIPSLLTWFYNAVGWLLCYSTLNLIGEWNK